MTVTNNWTLQSMTDLIKLSTRHTAFYAASINRGALATCCPSLPCKYSYQWNAQKKKQHAIRRPFHCARPQQHMSVCLSSVTRQHHNTVSKVAEKLKWLYGTILTHSLPTRSVSMHHTAFWVRCVSYKNTLRRLKNHVRYIIMSRTLVTEQWWRHPRPSSTSREVPRAPAASSALWLVTHRATSINIPQRHFQAPVLTLFSRLLSGLRSSSFRPNLGTYNLFARM
jgi:hypothetical protein